MRSLVGFSLMTSLNEKSLLLPPSSINSARSCLHTKRPGPFFPTSFQTRNDRDSRREEESGAYASRLETLTHFLRQRPFPAGGQPCSGRFRRSMRQRANSDWRSFLRMRKLTHCQCSKLSFNAHDSNAVFAPAVRAVFFLSSLIYALRKEHFSSAFLSRAHIPLFLFYLHGPFSYYCDFFPLSLY